MKRNIIYVGLDVDDTQYHGSALNKNSGEVIDFKCRPTLKGLLGQLEKLGKYFPRRTLKLCYEASYVGYTLQRDLAAKGYHCDVVAPTSIPSPRGKQIKTDRIDAGQLAQFYANAMVSIVRVWAATQAKQDCVAQGQSVDDGAVLGWASRDERVIPGKARRGGMAGPM